jgi:hypothetical protein
MMRTSTLEPTAWAGALNAVRAAAATAAARERIGIGDLQKVMPL